MRNQLLILTIIALLILIYFKNQLSKQYFYASLIAIIGVFIFLTRYASQNIQENFNSDETSQREVRYGDIITLWGWTNQFINMKSDNIVGSSPRFTKPEEIPRVGMIAEFMVIEDPKEISLGINNNNNPVMYGDKILFRSTYRLGYLGINPSSNDQSVIVTPNRNEWAQFQLVSTDPSAKGGQAIKYGDQLYLKTNRTPAAYIGVVENGNVIQSTVQNTKSLFTIYDRYGQGTLIDWARRGTATQSSIYANFLPNNAIDGNLLSFNHTQNDNNSWWQVTLPRDIYIDKINITNRHDCCQNRLHNFDVMILDQNNTLIATKYFETAGASISWNNINQIGRLVKVQLRSMGPLHMSEVNVYGNAINYSLLLEKPLSADLLNEPKTYSSTTANDDLSNTLMINSFDLPYNNKSKTVTLTMFLKLLKTNPEEVSILHKGSNEKEKSPAITVLPNSTRLRMYYGTSQSSSQFFDDSNHLPLNQWVHVAYIIDGGINEDTGWIRASFSNKLPQAPFESCCYYINPITKQYYYLGLNVAQNKAQTNVLDPSVLDGLKYMGQLDPDNMKPKAMFYINGVLRNSIELNDAPKLNTSPLSIGKSSSLNFKSGDFVIDQLKYFNYKITAQQISQLMRTPLIGITKTLITQTQDAKNVTKFEPNQLPHIENDFTVNFWLKTTRPQNGTGNLDQIFLKGNNSTDKAPAMWFHPENNTLHMPIRTKNTAHARGEGITQSNFLIPINEWHHVTLTLKDLVQTLYIDGQQVNQVTLSDAAVFNVSPMTVGGFEGQLVNFQFSNFSMTTDQVIIAMGTHPDEQYNLIIRQIWKDSGCLNNPIPENQPNKYAEWKNLIKNDQKSRVEGIIREIKKKADSGDKQMQELCYGKFTAGMLEKLAEKDQLIQYSLEQQKQATQCLPIAPFDCPQKNINDFDIRTHKNFNKYTLSSRIQKCNQPIQNIHTNPDYVKLKKELDDSKLMITKLDTLKQELEKENSKLNQVITMTSQRSQLTTDQLMQYPAFTNLKNQHDSLLKNLQQVTSQLHQHRNYVNEMQNKLESQDILQNPEYQKLLSENENNRKLAQTNLINNFDLSQLKDNPLFMQTLEDIKKNALSPQQCTVDQINNSPQYQQLKKRSDDFDNQILQANNLSKQALDELQRTKNIVAEILKNINNVTIDNQTMQKLLQYDVNDPTFQKLLQQIKNGKNQQHSASTKIEDHPQYNELIQKIFNADFNNIPKHLRCWGCELPQ